MDSPRKAAFIAVSMGDPAGIGPEVILKAVRRVSQRSNPPAIIVVGDLQAMRSAAARLSGDVPMPREWHTGIRARWSDGVLPILSIGKLSPQAIVPGSPTIEGADAAYRYVLEGARMTTRGEAVALVTGPINKEWLNRAGHHFPGHSELLARIAHVRTWRMMFVGEMLRVALVTVHMALADVSRALTRNAVLGTIRLLGQHLRSQLGIARPRIIVLGFNPHAGENGLFGSEEERAISPAIRQAQQEGIDAHGPVASDTAFIRHGRNQRFSFDGAVAMYHDQGLIPLKTLEFDRAVNITLGLPFIRTSPDHGTAYEIAGRGIANATSMAAAIEYAARCSRGAAKSGRLRETAADKHRHASGRFLHIRVAPKESARSDISRNQDRYLADG
jgi:4-phospho-D-threonate 3-dehydrogenase / 4-phospho-D-erythronate 3-dehydrogenase